ncbi:ubiquitin-protein ligase Sel1/Ubx2 [Ophiocordyceps camponoti-floridani]|uniref:Ubiquitin-protein ligase Sel1/Ubx2 n=1 Tax=Ophiocordyceps camponoti-floridani TaxID=2030778 RepID=A0A8H4Q8F9_9HYPO|nr:ubiquitin-protein ligase Sel1/Ubx2 [Ophiocordyceps camponoti-floridani]
MDLENDQIPAGWVREGDFLVPWWQSRTGVIIKWVVFLVIVLLFTLYVLGGYLHARYRIKKGLPPLAYHRCLVARRMQPPPMAGHHNGWPQQGYYGPPPPNGFAMNNMGAPPVYDPTRPPTYMGAPPPDGGSKVDPSQWRNEPTRREPEPNGAPDYQARP